MSDRDKVPALGAFFSEDETLGFRVWAPDHERMEVCLYESDGKTERARVPMSKEHGGFFEVYLESPGDAPVVYKFSPSGGGPFPDPFSRSQPFGVHGPSEAIDERFAWNDEAFAGVSLDNLVIYELHVGAATKEGTFEALIPRLPAIAALGVTAIELMPLGSFPGKRNWGYDGVCLFAPQASYGGPRGLRRLVDAAHAQNLGVIIDAVYNHLGPDGNYLRAYGKRYFTDRYHTPWGDALDVGGPGNAVVRELLARSAEMWIREFHADGLRLDATHEIHDESDPHILREIAERARRAGDGRKIVVIAEDERNDERLVRPVEKGGIGLDAVWADDFHHEMRRAFAGDKDGYFQDFSGTAEEIALTLERGWFYEGQLSKRTGKKRGTSARGIEPERLVYTIQNHDQIGNRAFGDRLGESVSPAAFRAMSALLLLAPYTPLLFMGQEWNARTPFLYFTDHEEELGRKVTEGRRHEFEGFAAFRGAEVPDPQAESTFLRSKLDDAEAAAPEHAAIRELYRVLLELRRQHPSLRERARGSFSARPMGKETLVLTRRGGGKELAIWVNVRGTSRHPLQAAERFVLSTEESRFGGAGSKAVEEGIARGTLMLEGPVAVVLEKNG